MNPITKWLKGYPNYSEGLELLREVAPNEASTYPEAVTEHNRQRLRAALEKYEHVLAPAIAQPTTATVSDNPAIASLKDEAKVALRQRSSIHSKLSSLSVDARRIAAGQIKQLTTEIDSIYSRIRLIESGAEVPTIQTGDRYHEGVADARRLQSLRTILSALKKKQPSPAEYAEHSKKVEALETEINDLLIKMIPNADA